jgi:2,3-bisphosphoglycerate-independent phosphoglycerate mutase
MKNVVLIVLDGFGLAPPGPGNAISLANPTTINSLFYSYPNTTLIASGESVGLPAHEVGNTEVGHLNLGAGRIVYQDLPRINMSIADGSFYKNPAFLEGIKHLQETHGDLHLLGLVGEGAVHSNVDHLFALLHLAKESHLTNVYVDVITDGRDSSPQSAINAVSRLEEKLKTLAVGKISSVMGRYYAMDRDRRWERTAKAYQALVQGSPITAQSALEAIKNSYAQNKTDEFIEPVTITADGKPLSLIKSGDTTIFYNFRIDRPRQLTKAFVLDNFEQDANKRLAFDLYAVKYYKTHYPEEKVVNIPFRRGPKISNLLFITMTEYEKGLKVKVAFPQITVPSTLGKTLSEHEINQLRLAESEKERFVTFYFNGQVEDPFPLEERLIIPSPKVATYDLKPEMSAFELTDALVQSMISKKFPFILINYANADMVGHTGNIDACIKAVQALDTCLARVIQTALDTETLLLVTGDHGNIEQKINPSTGKISTEHTANPVPFIVVDKKYQGKLVKLQSGILADVAPTVLALLGIVKPTVMTGRNLLEGLK